MDKKKLKTMLSELKNITNDEAILGQLWIVATFEELIEALLNEDDN